VTPDIMGLAASLTAAAQSGLLLALHGGTHTAADLARTCALDPRATERVLDVLVAYGFAVRAGDAFAASRAFSELLANSPGGPSNTLGMWMHVPTFLKSGAPYMRMDASREATYANVVAALGKLFTASATELAGKLERAPRHVLDIGCGSGVWGLAIAQQVPGARVTGPRGGSRPHGSRRHAGRRRPRDRDSHRL
jgi:hypothetical protein